MTVERRGLPRPICLLLPSRHVRQHPPAHGGLLLNFTIAPKSRETAYRHVGIPRIPDDDKPTSRDLASITGTNCRNRPISHSRFLRAIYAVHPWRYRLRVPHNVTH